MSIGRNAVVRMDLAALNMAEVEEHEPGRYRHRDSLAAKVARWFERQAAEAPPNRDVYAWHSIEELIERIAP